MSTPTCSLATRTPPTPSRSSSPISQSNANGHAIIDKDEDYYFVDVVFLVEGSLFRVPRAPFEQMSTVFSDIFRLPVPENRAPDGSSDEQPFRLDGIKKRDFRLLLHILVPRFPHSATPPSWKEWLSILELALMWEIEQVRDLAIERITWFELNTSEWVDLLRLSTSRQGFCKIREKAINELTHRHSLPPVDRILLARECCVVDWLLDGYKELVDRDAIITVEEEEQLGIHATVKLFRILMQARDGGYSYGYGRDDLVLQDIRADFQAELQTAVYVFA